MQTVVTVPLEPEIQVHATDFLIKIQIKTLNTCFDVDLLQLSSLVKIFFLLLSQSRICVFLHTEKLLAFPSQEFLIS